MISSFFCRYVHKRVTLPQPAWLLFFPFPLPVVCRETDGEEVLQTNALLKLQRDRTLHTELQFAKRCEHKQRKERDEREGRKRGGKGIHRER